MAANVNYFEGYNLPHTKYGGQTKVLTASATVVPNQTYEIKLVVADQGDSAWDSAILLEAGGFNIGLDLGGDMTVSGGNPACDASSVILDTQIPINTASHTWYLDGVEIVGEIDSTLEATTNGTYSVVVDYGSNCAATDSVVIEFTSSPIANPVSNQLICDDNNDGFWNFNLPSFNTSVLGTQTVTDFTITYHESQTDADTNVNPLPNNYINQNAYQAETIYAGIENNINPNCFDTVTFEIDVFETPSTIPLLFEQCDNALDGDDTNGYTEFDLNTVSSQILGVQTPAQYNISYHLNQMDAENNAAPLPLLFTNTTLNQQDIIVRIENVDNTDCYATSTISLMVHALPTISPVVALEQCDDNLDGLTDFNLNEANILISNNTSN